MENVEVKFVIGCFNKIPYGISISLIRALPHLTTLGFKISYENLRKALKDFDIFYQSDNLQQYVYYVLKTSILHSPAALSFTTEYSTLMENCKHFKNSLISVEEYFYMQKIYSNFVDEAINNFLDIKEIFPIVVDINVNDVKTLYSEISSDKEKMKKFIDSFINFASYNGFAVYRIQVFVLKNKKRIRLKFCELEQNNMTSAIIKNGDIN